MPPPRSGLPLRLARLLEDKATHGSVVGVYASIPGDPRIPPGERGEWERARKGAGALPSETVRRASPTLPPAFP